MGKKSFEKLTTMAGIFHGLVEEDGPYNDFC